MRNYTFTPKMHCLKCVATLFVNSVLIWCFDPLTEDDKALKKSSSVPTCEVGQVSEKKMKVVPPANKPPENMNTALELKDPSLDVKSSPTNSSQPVMPNDSWLQVCKIKEIHTHNTIAESCSQLFYNQTDRMGKDVVNGWGSSL